MGFWDEHAKAEASHAAATVAVRWPGLNAPNVCYACGHLGTDVLFGACDACYAAWSPREEH